MPQLPSPPKPVREGGRWRHVKPSADEVAEWFRSVPLDEGMVHEDYVAGVVLIPASERVKRVKEDGRGTEEAWEDTFTPYLRVDTRISYFRKLAELRGQVAVIEPVAVPTIEEGATRNSNLPPGFFWLTMGESGSAVRFLCATWRVALYESEAWHAEPREIVAHGDSVRVIDLPRPSREGIGTKQVAERTSRGVDPNALARAETGAIGRALGVAGILVVGTGVASYEDMLELRDAPVAQPTLPAAVEDEVALNERLLALQAELRPHEAQWRSFAAWWTERSQESGWRTVVDAPVEVRRGILTKMAELIVEAERSQQDASHVISAK